MTGNNIIFSYLNNIAKRNGDKMVFENRLKEYRNQYGINQEQLGKLAGVSRQTISLIERGDYYPSVLLALKIAKIFSTTVEELFIYEENGE